MNERVTLLGKGQPLPGTTNEDAERLIANGYEPIVVCGKAPIGDAWSTAQITPGQFASVRGDGVATDRKGVLRQTGTGLRTGELVGGDVDVVDTAIVDHVIDALHEVLPRSPFRRVGARGAMLCWLNFTPVRKLWVKGKPEGWVKGDKLQGLEILGIGQQFVAYGVHPDTGRPYAWQGEASPLNTGLLELPAVTPEQLAEAIAAVQHVLVECGFSDVESVFSDRGGKPGEVIACDTVEGFAALGDPMTYAQFIRTLSFIDPDCGGQRDPWRNMVAAILAAPVVQPKLTYAAKLEVANAWSRGDFWIAPSAEYLKDDAGGNSQFDAVRAVAMKPKDGGGAITVKSLIREAEAASKASTNRKLGTVTLGLMGRQMAAQEPFESEMPEAPIRHEDTEGFDAWAGVAKAKDTSPEVPYPDDKPDESVFPSYFIGEIDSIPDPQWLVKYVLLAVGIQMLYGPPGALKTFLALDMLLHAAREALEHEKHVMWAASHEYKLRGFKVTRPLRVAIVAGEGVRGLKRRIKAWVKRNGGKGIELSVMLIPKMPKFKDKAELDKLIRTIKAKTGGVDVVLVDTAMRASVGLNMSLPADSQVFIDACEYLRDQLQANVTFVHHTGKNPENGPLGAENLKAGVDQIDLVTLVSSGIGTRTIKVDNERAKDGSEREDLYFLATLEKLGEDEDGDPVSSLVLSRIPPIAKPDGSTGSNENLSRLNLAIEIIEENTSKSPMGMVASVLADSILAEEAKRGGGIGREKSDGERADDLKDIARWIRTSRENGGLKAYAFKTDIGKKTAPWYFKVPVHLRKQAEENRAKRAAHKALRAALTDTVEAG